MRILEHEQGTEAWLQSRLGCPSGSGFSKLIKADGKPSTQAEGYINQLIAEKLTGRTTEVKVTEWMQRGTEQEPTARLYYELVKGVEVQQVGFCMHDQLAVGVSPDGLVGLNGGLEIKVPKVETFVKYRRSGQLPSEYKAQVHGCLWITEREYWDFMAFHETMKPMIIRVYRDEAYIKALEEAVIRAVETIQSEVERLRRMQ